MRNRQIIEYLVYPKIFHSHSMLYKGVYCVSFKIYHVTRSKNITCAYPFPIDRNIVSSVSQFPPPQTTHQDSNFSYQTEKFQIVYAEQRKIIQSQCIFRLQYDISKIYDTFISIKLLRKQSSKAKQQSKYCVRKIDQTKYETIDTQILEIKKDSFNLYMKVYFRSSQFYSSVDFYICNFNMGHKLYRSKMQISTTLDNTDLKRYKPLQIMKEKLQNKKESKVNLIDYMYLLLKDSQNTLPSFYYQLLNMLHEYERLLNLFKQTFHIIQQKASLKVKLQATKLVSLDYIKMKSNKVNLINLHYHYQAAMDEIILALILQQKQLIRKNLRLLRNQFCVLITKESVKQFQMNVQREINSRQAALERLFVAYNRDIFAMTNQEKLTIRMTAEQQLNKQFSLINQKYKQMPLLLIERDEQIIKSKTRKSTLTVFIHGYQGNRFDFQKAKNYLKKQNQNTKIIMVESISGQMNQSIESLGILAADQIKRNIEGTLSNYQSINFVGFSLGGIIARSAFNYLRQYWPKFGIFITFSSPHLGIAESDNNLVNIGVWYLIKVDKVKNLKELNFQSVTFNDSLLMKLSNCEGLSNFSKIILVCSKNDGFVPFYSTALNQKMCDKLKVRDLCLNMKRMIKNLERVQVMFEIENASTLDKLTGRKGHIQFLDNDLFLQTFFKVYGKLF